MSRLANDQCDRYGRLLNGYDYERQAWVQHGRYVRCGHPATMQCGCYGRMHEGQFTPSPRDLQDAVDGVPA